MKRRSFIKSSMITGVTATIVPALGHAKSHSEKLKPQYYELKVYTFSTDQQQKMVIDYFKKAAIPALNRAGVNHVGVFTELKPGSQKKLYVIVPYENLEHFNEVKTGLANDSVYQQQGATYLSAPASAPAYERIESSLLKAFAKMPGLSVPNDKPRIFELRQYQSASENAGLKKIEMFNDQGEIAIFKRLGFRPVFFGQTIIGGLMPNLTYMVTFDDMAAHDRCWKSFGSDPEWKKISSVPEYADALLVSKIVSTFIVPTDFSQI